MIYVLSDIHGHEGRFDSVLRQIDLHPDDTLYIIGKTIIPFAASSSSGM